MKTKIEVTDTFGGEANYSWVKRTEIEIPEGKSELSIIKRCKAAIGWNGLRCRVEKYGDMIRLTPFRHCITCFITFEN